MISKIGFGLLWLAFIGYAFLLAPPDQPDTLILIQHLATGNWVGINPLVVALFNLMGIWPLVYSCLLLVDGRGQSFPAWPFALGAFAILPYLALRQPYPQFTGKVEGGLRILESSRWLAISLGLAAISLVGYALLAGNWQDFGYQWQTSRFIHVMSWDFCLLSLLFSVLVDDDLSRRQMNHPQQWQLLTLIPLLGPLVYLGCRSPLANPAGDIPDSLSL